jgi:hypothetical protein
MIISLKNPFICLSVMVKNSVILLLFLLPYFSIAQRLDRFAGFDASGNKTGYQHIKSYYGFIDSLMKPEINKEGLKCYYVYFSLSDTLTDLGIRIVNPVPELAMPDKGDEVSDNYYEHEKDKSGAFNPHITLQKKQTGIEPGNMQWESFNFIRDDKDKPDPATTVLRIIDKKKNRLVPNQYRIVISSSSNNEIRSGFLVQLGSMGIIKSVKLTMQP